MKRYIRLENRKIIDLEETKKKITDNEYYTDYRDFELLYNESCDILSLKWKATCTEKCTLQKAGATHNGGITFNYNNAKIVAESDNVTDLIMAGDMVEYKGQLLTVYRHSKLDKKYCDKDVTKIYTKQGDDYKLVWAKERGVIHYE